MLNIFKATPSSWSQQAIVDVFNKKLCEDVKRNTISQVLSSSNKIVGIQSEAAKDVQRVRHPKYPELEMPWWHGSSRWELHCNLNVFDNDFFRKSYCIYITIVKELYKILVKFDLFSFCNHVKTKDGELTDEMLMWKVAIVWEFLVTKLADYPIKVRKYKNFKISNG